MRAQAAELVDRAARDAHTGALTPDFFRARLAALLGARGGEGVAVVLLSLDGADADALEDAAAMLTETVRRGDLVGRVGASCFAVAAVTDAAEAPVVARRLARTLAPLGPITLGLGHAVSPEGAARALDDAARSLRDARSPAA
jgi:GGDEF domain-containing protein